MVICAGFLIMNDFLVPLRADYYTNEFEPDCIFVSLRPTVPTVSLYPVVSF